jgi:DNA-binding protein HU-beta
VNKAQLIEALANRLGDKRAASAALDAVLAEIQAAVTKGDRVAITGFGAFEKRVRGARTARNPRTGEAVKVKKTSVPAFRAGAGFKEMVASGKVPKVAAAKKTATKTATKAAGAKATSARATSARATKSTAAKSTAAKSTAKKTAAKKTTAKAAKTTRAASTRSTARTTATAKAPTAKRAPATKKR